MGMGKWIAIPKKSGGTRRIYIPDEEEKASLRARLPELRKLYNRCIRVMTRTGDSYWTEEKRRELRNAVCGFVHGHSPVTCAMQHIGYQYTVSVDLEDFFDTVTEEMVIGVLRKASIDPPPWLPELFRDGIAAQGLPTSPLVSNLAALPLDLAIINYLNSHSNLGESTYTRYADDITISFRSVTSARSILDVLDRFATEYGFRINPRKTRIQSERAGRRIICGVGVSKDGIHPTRRTRRILRAARHQRRRRVVRGLEEWRKLKLPRRKMWAMSNGLLTCCGNDRCQTARSELLRMHGVMRADEFARTIDMATKLKEAMYKYPVYSIVRQQEHSICSTHLLWAASAGVADVIISACRAPGRDTTSEERWRETILQIIAALQQHDRDGIIAYGVLEALCRSSAW